MPRPEPAPIDVEVALFHETEKAYLVGTSDDREKAVWVPKSQCELGDERKGRSGRYDIYELTLPQWLAEDKGLV